MKKTMMTMTMIPGTWTVRLPCSKIKRETNLPNLSSQQNLLLLLSSKNPILLNKRLRVLLKTMKTRKYC